MLNFRRLLRGLEGLVPRPRPAWLWVLLVLASVAAAPPAATRAEEPWLTLSTPRVRVHFHPGYETAAIAAARAAEEAIDRLASALGHEPQGPVHIALMDVADLANGFTDVLYYGRIVIYPAFPVGLGYTTGLSPRMSDWLQLVVTHEVVHAVHLDMAEGPARGVRQLFGHVPGLSTPNIFQPLAFLEGLATFEETRLVEGGRGKDPLYDMFLRAAVLESALPSMDQALGNYDLGYFQPGAHVYLYGYTWFEMLDRHFGAEGIRDLQKRFASTTGLMVPGEAVRRVLGQEMESLWRRMRQELEARYRDEIATIRAAGETRPEPLEPAAASGAWVALSPRLSPDGRYLAYAASGPYLEDLRVVDLASGRDRQLAVGLTTAPGGLDWSRDGRYVLYAAADDVAGRLFSDLYGVEVATGRVERLTHGRRAYAPAAGPGGSIAFIAREGLETRVMVRDGAGGERLLWEPPAGWQLLSLAWSPQGDRLAAAAWKPGGGSDLVILHLAAPGTAGQEGPAVQRVQAVTDDPFVEDRPSWSPDGRYLLFHSDRDGVYNLYAFDTGSGQLWRLTNVVTGAFDPAMSPDGRSVYFSWFGARGYRLARLSREALRWEPVELRRAPAPGPAAGGSGEAAGGAGGASALPPSWRIEPYRPWESLRPTYWQPLFGNSWPGPFVGAMTSGMDALGQQAYAVAGAVGLGAGAPVLYAGYARLLGDVGAPVLTVESLLQPETAAGSGEPEPGAPFDDVASASAQLSWQRAGYTGGWSVALGATRTWFRDAFPAGEPWSAADRESWLSAGWLAYRQGGDHRRVAVQQWSLQGDSALELRRQGPVDPLKASTLVARWAYAGQRVDGASWAARLAAGVSGGQLSMPGGGESGPFAVRAYDPEVFNSDGIAVGLSAERAWRLAALRFGLADAPTFFDDVSLALYTEAAAGWDRAEPDRPLTAQSRLLPSPGSPAAAAGAELRLRLTLQYGRVGLVLRLGVAQGFAPAPRTRWYFRLETR